MTNLLTFASAAALFAALSLPAAAASYSISFTGEVDRTNAGDNSDVPSIGSLAPGDDVSGSFLLDTGVPGSGGSTIASYGGAVTGFSMTFDGLGFTGIGPAAPEVSDDAMHGSSAPLIDAFRVSSAVMGPSVGGLAPSLFQFALGGTETGFLGDTSMPDPADFPAWLAVSTLHGNWNYLTFEDGSDVRFRVTSVTAEPSAVPLPAGAPLLIAGLGGLIALRRRTRTRSGKTSG